MAQDEPMPPDAVLMQMINGKIISKALGVAADLGVADALGDETRSAEELAERCEASPDALYRTLRALAAVGVFEEAGERSFRNNPVSQLLRADVKGSMRPMVRWFDDELHWRLWNEMEHCVRTGDTAFSKLFPGEDVFEVLARHPRSQAVFQEAMTALSSNMGQAIVGAYDFGAFGRIVDVGGGHGSLALTIKQAAPNADVTVFDLPHVIEGAQEMLSASGHGGQVHTASGSFFEGVPGPADAYVMKSIIHDWPDAECVKLLSHCRDNLASEQGRVLICEMVVGDGPESVPAKLLDLEMLVLPGGRERTEAEFSELLSKAGLKLGRIVRTESPMCVVEAAPA